MWELKLVWESRRGGLWQESASSQSPSDLGQHSWMDLQTSTDKTPGAVHEFMEALFNNRIQWSVRKNGCIKLARMAMSS